jgi:predicted RNase H-like HicB family nuclease
MSISYWAIVFKEPDTDFWINIPDLPGCFSNGESAEEAIANMREAAALHASVMKERGMELPAPRSEADILKGDLPAFFKTCEISIES